MLKQQELPRVFILIQSENMSDHLLSRKWVPWSCRDWKWRNDIFNFSFQVNKALLEDVDCCTRHWCCPALLWCLYIKFSWTCWYGIGIVTNSNLTLKLILKLCFKLITNNIHQLCALKVHNYITKDAKNSDTRYFHTEYHYLFSQWLNSGTFSGIKKWYLPPLNTSADYFSYI